MDAGTDDPRLANIRQEWHWVKPGLEEILANSPDINEIPEDVYASCISGQAHLWVTPDYFVVTRFLFDEEQKGLLIWKAWSKDRGNRYSIEGHKFFERLALSQQCEFMQTQTAHAPLVDHFLTNLGYRVESYILTKDIG